MRHLIAFLILIILSGCCWDRDWRCVKKDKNPKPGPMMTADFLLFSEEIPQIVLPYADELKSKERINLRHSYVYRDDEGNYIIWLDFYTQLLYDVDQTRRLMVHVVEGLLERLNADGQLYSRWGAPFTFEDLYVSIDFESFFGIYVDPLYMSRAVLLCGTLTAFYANTATDMHTPVYHKHEEPYVSSRLFVAIEEGIDEAKKKEVPAAPPGPREITLIPEQTTTTEVKKEVETTTTTTTTTPPVLPVGKYMGSPVITPPPVTTPPPRQPVVPPPRQAAPLPSSPY